VYESSQVRNFEFETDSELDQRLEGLGLDQLMSFEHQGIPLGKLVLPSLRWILRRHNLTEDLYTTTLYRNYIRSAWSLARQFEQLIKELDPQSVVFSTACSTLKQLPAGLPAARRQGHQP
jgi:hypothetical protein